MKVSMFVAVEYQKEENNEEKGTAKIILDNSPTSRTDTTTAPRRLENENQLKIKQQ